MSLIHLNHSHEVQMWLKHHDIAWIQFLQLNLELMWRLHQTHMDVEPLNDVLYLIDVLYLESELLLLTREGCFGIH